MQFPRKKVASKITLKSTDRTGNLIFKNPQIVRSGWIMPKSIDVVDNDDKDDYGEYDEEYGQDEDLINIENGITEEFPFIIPRIATPNNVQLSTK